MAVLTVSDILLEGVDEFAQNEEVSREEFVQKAIDKYLRDKAMERLRAEGCTPQVMQMAKKFLTDEDFSAFVEEEIHAMREEQRRNPS